MMNLPLVFRANVRPFVVYGAGEIAARKIKTLVRAGANVSVVALAAHDTVQALANEQQITLFLRSIAVEHERFTAAQLVVIATNNPSLNAQLAMAARAQGALVCRVDDNTASDFIFPAVIDRSPLLVSISSGGSSPALTRYLRQRLETFLPDELRQLGRYVERLRDRLKSDLPESERRSFWRRWMQSTAPEQILSNQANAADISTQQVLDNRLLVAGDVALVGAGPGDPDLLTFRALRLLQSADVVFYDRLVGERIMALIDPATERYYVGKSKSNHSVPQEDINQLLVDYARQGKRVVRLKGGDPFIFGRGGEEIAQLADSGIPFQVVPGITAASGCAAYAGIPLTHRDHAQSVRFVTGHLKDGSCDLPWSELIHPQQTLVIYMGLTGIAHICKQLTQYGMPADTPIALIEKGTLPDQCVHTGTLATMPDLIATRSIQAPTLTIVGSVVSLHKQLRWR